jgi:hypothetical protein
MAISFYDLSVGSYLRTLTAFEGVLARGLTHCEQTGADPDALAEARLAPDMLPLAFQVRSVAHHSIGALEGLKRGTFAPPGASPPLSYAQLQAIAAETKAALAALAPDEINGLEGGELMFQLGEHSLPFTAEGFLLSFSLPNFYFHATTAYDILRANGVALGKRQFLGQLTLKT